MLPVVVKVQVYLAQPVVGTDWALRVGAKVQLLSLPLLEPTDRLVVNAVPAVCLI